MTNLSPFPHGPDEGARVTFIGSIVALVLGSMLVAATHLQRWFP